MTGASKREQILDVAEGIVRSLGYNAFSYADIASKIGVSKPNIHHHFSTKGDLGLELIKRFRANVRDALADIAQQHSTSVIKLREYAGLFETSLEENKMCLCGVLAVEHETLTQDMQLAINDFFVDHETWVEKILLSGKENGELDFDGDALDHARLIVSSMQGALLVAKSQRSMPRIKSNTENLIGNYRALQRC